MKKIALAIGLVVLLVGLVMWFHDPIREVSFRTGHAYYKLNDPRSGEGWIKVNVTPENGFENSPVESTALSHELLQAVPITGATLKNNAVGVAADQSGRIYMVWVVRFEYRQGGVR